MTSPRRDPGSPPSLDDRTLRLGAAVPGAAPRFNSRPLQPRSLLWDQDLCEGPALEAFFIDDVELQMLFQLGEWALARADRNWDRGQLVLVDKPQAGHRLGEVGAAV